MFMYRLIVNSDMSPAPAPEPDPMAFWDSFGHLDTDLDRPDGDGPDLPPANAAALRAS